MQNGFLLVLEASQPHANGIGELAPIPSSLAFKGLASDAMAVNVGSRKWHIARVRFGVDVGVIRSTAMVTSSATTHCPSCNVVRSWPDLSAYFQGWNNPVQDVLALRLVICSRRNPKTGKYKNLEHPPEVDCIEHWIENRSHHAIPNMKRISMMLRVMFWALENVQTLHHHNQPSVPTFAVRKGVNLVCLGQKQHRHPSVAQWLKR
jgi:hypothetical protein